MEKIVVTSDVHGSYSAWEKAEEYYRDSDLVLYAGDILYHGARNPLTEDYNTKKLSERLNCSDYDLMMVKGNVDALVDDWVLPYPLPEYALVDRDGLRIVVYHGYQHKYKEERVDFAKRFGADILVFGHTHKPLLEEKEGVILLNPGSLSLPKQTPANSTLSIIEGEEIKIITLEAGKILASISGYRS